MKLNKITNEFVGLTDKILMDCHKGFKDEALASFPNSGLGSNFTSAIFVMKYLRYAVMNQKVFPNTIIWYETESSSTGNIEDSLNTESEFVGYDIKNNSIVEINFDINAINDFENWTIPTFSLNEILPLVVSNQMFAFSSVDWMKNNLKEKGIYNSESTNIMGRLLPYVFFNTNKTDLEFTSSDVPDVTDRDLFKFSPEDFEPNNYKWCFNSEIRASY